jgi:hypothetical protein
MAPAGSAGLFFDRAGIGRSASAHGGDTSPHRFGRMRSNVRVFQ